MWQERLTGKCLQSKRMPDGMKTVYWSMEVLLNWIEDGFKVGVLFASSKQQQSPPKKKKFPSPGIALDLSLHRRDLFSCLFICFFFHSTAPEKNFKVKSSVITYTAEKEKANWLGLRFFYCLPHCPPLSPHFLNLKEFLTQCEQIKMFWCALDKSEWFFPKWEWVKKKNKKKSSW